MTLDDDGDWTLMARYLAGECSAAERAVVEQWLAADPRRRAELAELRRWWTDAAAIPPASRVDAMWTRLAYRMHAGASGAPAGGADHAAPGGLPRRHAPMLHLAATPERRRPRWVAVAAGLAACATIAAGGLLVMRRPPAARQPVVAEAPPREFTTARGQHATIRLADGTRVELGFASTLRVRPFTGGRRELTLEGEAVFDVVHDSTQPFVVHAANAVTEDLGTTFSVRAYPGDSAVRVVVVSGKVAMRARDAAGAGNATVLGPGELGRLDLRGRVQVQSRVDTTAYLAWLAQRVAYANERLGDIAADLERRFDVTVRIADAAAASQRVTVDLPAASLDDVLDAVAVPLGLRHRRTGRTVVLEH
jgi:transmembrane sensor